MRLLHSHPVGSSFVRQALQAFEEAGWLAEYWTTIARAPESGWDRFLPGAIVSEMRRRSYSPEILAKTHRGMGRELARLMAGKSGRKSLTRHEGLFSYDAVAQDLDRRVARRLTRGGLDTVYAYEDSALQTFRSADKIGVRSVYELPIGHWRLGHRIFAEEAELCPDWAMTLEGLKDSREKLDRKDEEAQRAKTIIVPSRFVAVSLLECPDVSAPVHVVNYGCPAPVDSLDLRDSGPLRVLFVGSLGARKGVRYVLQAVEGLNVELTLIGPKPAAECPALDAGLAKHQYLGSIPREQVLEAMRANEVFLFPSLFEGLANVLLESMSQGLMPITTPNSGAEGVIDSGIDGFLVPVRSVDSLKSCMTAMIEDRPRLNQMRLAATEKARKRSWSRYRAELIQAVQL